MPNNIYLAIKFKVDGEGSEDRRGMMDYGSKDWYFQLHLKIDLVGLIN